jgi:hypothetical protein
MASQATVFRLLRPRAFSDMIDLLDLLEAHWSGAEAHASPGAPSPQTRGVSHVGIAS